MSARLPDAGDAEGDAGVTIGEAGAIIAERMCADSGERLSARRGSGDLLFLALLDRLGEPSPSPSEPDPAVDQSTWRTESIFAVLSSPLRRRFLLLDGESLLTLRCGESDRSGVLVLPDST